MEDTSEAMDTFTKTLFALFSGAARRCHTYSQNVFVCVSRGGKIPSVPGHKNASLVVGETRVEWEADNNMNVPIMLTLR